MKILAVSRDPVAGNVVLGSCQIQIAAANHVVKVVLELIFYMSVPHCVVIRLRPKIANIGSAAELRSD